jgi:hypothetical protein
MKLRAGALIGFAAYLGGYCALLAWFKRVDVYHAHFATAGLLVVVYNAFRVLFIFYLFWIVHTAGALLLRAIAGDIRQSVSTLEHLALSFFAGAGIWHIALLALGYLNLYTVPVSVAVTLPFVALSYRKVRAAFEQLHGSLAAWRSLDRLTIAGAVLIALFAGTLLGVKGLYPGGGHDYFSHYFYFYQTVIDQGGIWPNDVWYHYYYSKGAGLYFLAILLTDPLAPQLVTFCFVGAAALALFLCLCRIASDTQWPTAGTILFLALYIYTPGVALYRNHGGWGDFEKLHELNASLVIAVLWMTTGALMARGRVRLIWQSALAAAITAAIIIHITAAAFFAMVFGLLAAWNLSRRHFANAAFCAALTFLAAFVLGLVLVLNYITTGLANDQGILFFWKFANIEKLANLGSLPLAMFLHRDSAGLTESAFPLFSSRTMRFVLNCLRLELFIPLAAVGAILCFHAALRRRLHFPPPISVSVLGVSLIATMMLALIVGRSQPISFYRFSSFTMPISIACSIAVWTSLPSIGTDRFVRYSRMTPMIITVACLLVAPLFYGKGSPQFLLRDAASFAFGSYSIDTAYQSEKGLPARMPWAGIHPASRAAYAIVGPHTRIWSLHMHSYCMLPDCRVQSHNAFIVTPEWDRLMFGNPEDGMRALQASGVNYFLISTELYMSDPLPRSPLFSPNNIGHYLGIRWTDGATTLLTWAGPNTLPISAEWLAEYRRAVEQSPTVQSFPYTDMQAIYARLNATPHPWHSFKLPWESR